MPAAGPEVFVMVAAGPADVVLARCADADADADAGADTRRGLAPPCYQDRNQAFSRLAALHLVP